MKKIILIILTVLILGIFFFIPFIPSTAVFQTKAQKERTIEFCKTGRCGLIFYYTPFQYVSYSIKNIFR